MPELTALKASIDATNFWLAAVRLHGLLGKANFNPNQPRVPRGQREGGRWTREGDGEPQAPTLLPELETDEDGRPRLPEERPSSPRVRHLLSRQLAAWLAELTLNSPAAQFWRAEHWINENAPAIWSYLDRPKTLWELQKAARNPRRGYEIHHIVEQDAARRDGFREALIEGENNLVLVPTYRHRDITAWFMKANEEFDGLSPRAYLRNKSWEERKRVGLKALIEAGVLKP